MMFFNLIVKYKLFYEFECILQILHSLNDGPRNDIFIAVTGLFVAIVVFLAELISNKKTELCKRLLLDKTQLKKNVIGIFITLGLMFICSVFDYDTAIKVNIITQTLFLITQIVLNIVIITMSFSTFFMFMNSIRLNTDSKYYNQKLNEYIISRLDYIEEKGNKLSTPQIKSRKKEIDEFLKKSKIFEFNKYGIFDNPDYVAIYPLSEGYIKDIKMKHLDKIEEQFESFNNKSTIDKFISNRDISFVFFVVEIGDRVDRKQPIGYCHKDFVRTFENLNQYFKIDKELVHYDDELELIINGMFELAKENQKEFDSYKIANIFEYLYENKYEYIKSKFIKRIEYEHQNAYKDLEYNYAFSRFLLHLASIAYRFKHIDDYSMFTKFVTYLFINRCEVENINLKDVSYEYANKFFGINAYEFIEKENYDYYECLISNLLLFVSILVRKKDFEAIKIILNNIDNNFNILKRKFDKLDILNFQFICGVVFSLIKGCKNCTENERIVIKEILGFIDEQFLSFHLSWDIISNFKTYFDLPSKVQEIYHRFDIDYELSKYQNSCITTCTDEREVLANLLIALHLLDGYISKDELKSIKKEDKVYFESLLKYFESNKRLKIEEVLDIDSDKTDLSNMIKQVIEQAKLKEEEFYKTTKLDNNKIVDFKNQIINRIKNDNKLLDYLRKERKLCFSKKIVERPIGTNTLIPREWFIDEQFVLSNLATQIGTRFRASIRNSYLDECTKKATLIKKPINEELKEIEIIDNYVLLLNPKEAIKLNVTNENKYSFSNQSIDVIRTRKDDKKMLINKKDLPVIYFCEFNHEKYEENKIENHIYFDIKDCSNDSKLRDNIIESADWISEKGDLLAQHEYLKMQCQFKMSLSFKIK